MSSNLLRNKLKLYVILVILAVRSKEWVSGRSLAGTVGSNPDRGMDVCCECCVSSGRGLSVGLITHPEESY